MLRPARFEDDRGHFSEVFNRRRFEEALGVSLTFVQDNESYSRRPYTVRGLHFQRPPHAQAKLVSCQTGRILDVVVDVRRGSATYGRWVSTIIDASEGWQVYLPAGFLHGFMTLQPDTLVAYKTTDYYSAECDGAVAFDDPLLAIDWGRGRDDVILSAKDAAAPALAAFQSPFTMDGNPT
jgi:dTDP-4-dehydrorhamnose 3,5-epimerase